LQVISKLAALGCSASQTANRIEQAAVSQGPMLPFYQNFTPTHIKMGNRLLRGTLRDGAVRFWR
jgi:hypothetical protein